MSTVSPRLVSVAVSRWKAVAPVIISPPAAAQSRPAGFGTIEDAGAMSSLA